MSGAPRLRRPPEAPSDELEAIVRRLADTVEDLVKSAASNHLEIETKIDAIGTRVGRIEGAQAVFMQAFRLGESEGAAARRIVGMTPVQLALSLLASVVGLVLAYQILGPAVVAFFTTLDHALRAHPITTG